ncbi:MAG TPA: hypothetical protein VGE62_00135 [Candidatus Paceibacterota bacterium]
MKILSLILAACILVSASSCVYSDKDGQMWVTGRQGKIRIPLPNDPLRKLLIDDPARERYEKRQAAMLASARSGQVVPQRVVSRNELLPPPATKSAVSQEKSSVFQTRIMLSLSLSAGPADG